MKSFNLLDLIFPQTCLSCGKFGQYICSSCILQIKFHQYLICPDCLKRTISGQKHKECKGYLQGLVAVWDYEQKIQKIIKQIKYQGYFAAVKNLVRLNYTCLDKSRFSQLYKFLDCKPILIPVPLHKKKMAQRGFNQAEKIAKAYAKIWHLPMSKKILIRAKNTRPQADLKKKARQKNIKNAFQASDKVKKMEDKPLIGKNIILIDDVWTTGSTMQECGKVLKKLGAGEIWALTLAR